MRSVVVVLVAFAGIAAAAACDETFETCYPGDWLGCTCANGAKGYAACASGVYGSCVCDGTTPGLQRASVLDAGRVDASVLASACADAGAKALFDDCIANEDCASCVCEAFAGRRRCSLPCSNVASCPAPSDACTARGFCRPPS